MKIKNIIVRPDIKRNFILTYKSMEGGLDNMEKPSEEYVNPEEGKKSPWKIVLVLLVILLACEAWYYYNNPGVNTSDQIDEGKSADGRDLSPDSLKIASEDGKDISQEFTVKSGDAEIGKMKEEFSFSVKRLAQTGDSLFLTTVREGVGGYVPFTDNYSCLYRIDLQSGKMEKIYNEEEGGVRAISHNGETLVVVSTDGIDGGTILKLYDLAQKNEFMPFRIPESKYDMVGNVAFSVDDNSMIYQTAISDPANKDYGVFGIDLSTSKQQKFDSYDGAKAWAGIS